MKKLLVKLFIVVLAVFTISGCSVTTNRMEVYKNLNSDLAVLCGGNTTNIHYIDSPKTTRVSCNGSIYEFYKNKQIDLGQYFK